MLNYSSVLILLFYKYQGLKNFQNIIANQNSSAHAYVHMQNYINVIGSIILWEIFGLNYEYTLMLNIEIQILWLRAPF